MAVPSLSEPLQWEKIGKVANQAKLAILSLSEPLWWEKIGKVTNQAKLAVPPGGPGPPTIPVKTSQKRWPLGQISRSATV